jgi:hypothetical protein
MLYVANAGDGSVRLFEGSDYAARERIALGRPNGSKVRNETLLFLFFFSRRDLTDQTPLG